jgi:phosphoglycerol transferase MdoB-like AlkP superfamily enzyme
VLFMRQAYGRAMPLTPRLAAPSGAFSAVLRRAVQAAAAFWLPAALRSLLPVIGAFLMLNLLVRLGLLAFNGNPALWWPWRALPALAVGALFDAVALSFVLPLLAWIAALWPARRRGLRVLLALLLLPLAGTAAFTAFAEFTFWNEFASRFNFIAVDYLIYTNEVIGNLRESYDLPLLLSGVALVALVLWWGVVHALRRQVWGEAGIARRARAALAWTLLPLLAFAAVDVRFAEVSRDAQLNEIAGDGYFAFWHAFRANQIDYERFYPLLPRAQAEATLAGVLATPGHAAKPFERDIAHAGPARPWNVVLISVESLSASFLGSFGDVRGLTPQLDRLATDGLLFTQLYATGTRTVRGLEALTLSVPPTPGNAIVKRPGNDHLFNLGQVFKDRGYEPLYLYGGYGYFDNMNAFFSGNGYTVVDRTALAPQDIHFENIWGVADEDLFSLTLRQLDQRHAAGTRFFAHVMTTSNHRPFTYPDGRIDIASKTGREGGVKYTDWAIGRFIDEARSRPWFDDTLFVIVADHTHNGRGKQELPPAGYHIPLIVYAPKLVQPGRVDTLASQIDVAPTLLGLLNVSYHSKFFGHDILREGAANPRALLANYQTVGYYKDGRVVELKPGGRSRVADAKSGRDAPDDALSRRLLQEAVSYYQVAAEAWRLGELKQDSGATAQAAERSTVSAAGAQVADTRSVNPPAERP